MKLVQLISSLLVALVLLAPATAAAKPGELDRDFGNGGRAVLRLPTSQTATYPQRPLAVAAGPRGRIAVAAGTRVLLLTNGRPQRSFGANGGVTIAPPPETRFLLGGAAIDSRGRVLVAGTLESTQSRAAVYRFLPNGSLDPGFGSGGSVVAPFGQVAGLAVDGEDRPVLAGSSAERVSSCDYMSQPPVTPTRTWVARLTAAGAPDPGFGEAGVYTNPGAEDPDNLALAPNGKIVFTNPTEERCPRIAAGKDEVVDFLGATGRAARVSFVATPGDDGVTTTVRSLAVDSRNRVVVLLADYQRERGGEVVAARIRRLRADGQLDTGFGANGSAATGLSREGLGMMALDRQGRILITARNEPSSRVVLARRGTRGKPDLNFGRDGKTSVSWGTKSVLGTPQVLADPNGAVVAAPIGVPDRGARLVALARFR